MLFRRYCGRSTGYRDPADSLVKRQRVIGWINAQKTGAILIKAADMLIARRADTKARADFATWKMMAKLNGGSALPPEAQKFLASYRRFSIRCRSVRRPTPPSTLLYKSYYEEMGGSGAAPDIRAHSSDPATDNVTAFKRPAVQRPSAKDRRRSGSQTPASRGADICLPGRGLCRRFDISGADVNAA